MGSYTRDVRGGSATPRNPNTLGFYYTGAVDGSTSSGYQSFQGRTQQGELGTYTFLHSVDGGLAVGNCGNAAEDDLTGYSLSSTAFIVDLATGDQIDIQFPGRFRNETHTAYGIWYNGNGRYTIAGGAGDVIDRQGGVLTAGSGYLIDYNARTGTFSHYTEFEYQNQQQGDFITHFEGIYRARDGSYRLPSTSTALTGEEELTIASVVTVCRRANGSFAPRAAWEDLTITSSESGAQSVLSTANSLYGPVTVGLADYPDGSGGLTQADFVSQRQPF